MSKEQICKVYGASFWHDSVNIVGSKESLTALRDAIDEAIEGGNSKVSFFESDGEGYSITVHCEERSWDEWCMLPVHYTDGFASDWSDNQREEYLDLFKGE